MLNKKSNSAFTLLEVMVAVMIISVVILALMTMYGNSTHIFLALKKKSKVTQYGSFFVSNTDYGFEKKDTSIDELVTEFKLEDDLRRELKNKKVKIIYQELENIDMREFDGSKDETDDETRTSGNMEEQSSNIIFEIGKTILKIDDSSVALLRLQVK